MLKYSKFKLHEIIFEIRYNKAYRLWDHAGDIAQNIMDANPLMDLVSANPSKLLFNQKSLNAYIELGRICIAQKQISDDYNLEDGKLFYNTYNAICNSAISRLQIKNYNRLGFRSRFHYSTKSESEAIKLWQKIPFVKLNIPNDIAEIELTPSITVPIKVKQLPDRLLTFRIERFSVDVNMNNSLISLSKIKDPNIKKIYKHSSNKRKNLLIEQIRKKKLLDFLPPYGILLDLDWYKEDLEDASEDDITQFVENCKKEAPRIVNKMIGDD